MRRHRGTAPAHAAAGVLAAAAGMAAAHLTAAMLDPDSSPVLAVGSTVIDATPTPVKEWAVREFGTADKPILIGSVVTVTLLAAGLAGVLARRRLRLGLALLAGLVALAATAALARPQAGPADLVPSLVAAVVGLSSLWWLVHVLHREDITTDPGAAQPTRSRRGFLIGSGVLLLGGAVAAGAGQWIIRSRSRIADIVLPRATAPGPPLPAGLEEQVPAISSFRTSNRAFYRVDTKLSVPLVDHRSWRLQIDGMVDRELSFGYDDLLAMPLEEHDITLTCVSNEVGGTLVGSARWLGVPVRSLLERAGLAAGRAAGADQVLSTDVDGFRISTPLGAVTDARPALVAVGMNGAVLPRSHGFPARLVVPGLYGFVGATKWLTRLTVTTYDAEAAYWTERDWATDAPIKISSRIETPRPLSTIAAGRHAVGGVAWAQRTGVAEVEVSIDGGPWQQAELGPEAGIDYWRQWHLPWDAEPGSHRLAVRATGLDGRVQTAVRASPFPDGSSGVQEIVVRVA